MENVAQYDDKKDAGRDKESQVRRWLREIEAASKREDKWRKKAEKAEKIYSEEAENKESSFNILWANTELLIPAIYNQPPIPDIRRTPLSRAGQVAPLADAAAECLEEALKSSIDNGDFDEAAESLVTDFALPGRGVMRVRYIPTIITMPPAEEGAAEMDVLADAALRFDFWPWRDYRRGAGKRWRDVPWMAYRHYMTKDEIKENFPKFDAEELDYNTCAETDEEEKDSEEAGVFKKAVIWEVWSKEDRKVFWVAPSYGDNFLREDDDPLGLTGFFDTPGALQYTNRTDSLVPVVPFSFYERQAKELNRVSLRINMLTEGLKLRGVYDETIGAVKTLLEAGDNEMISAGKAAAAMENGGLDRAIWFMPIERIAQILAQLYQAREQAKQAIYEITGLSDILRGSSDPNETLGAQQLKAQTGSKRLARIQKKTQRYLRDVLRIAAEIIGEHFTPEILSNICGKPVTPEIAAVLRDDRSRFFLIDIETDSTIAPDEQAEQQNTTELLAGIGQYMGAIGPAVQAGGVSMQEARELLGVILKRFKLGKEVERALEKSGQQQQGQQQGQQGQGEQQAAQQQIQAEMMKEQAKLALEERIAQQELAMKERVAMAEIVMKERVEMAKLSHQRGVDAAHLSMEVINNERESSEGNQGAV